MNWDQFQYNWRLWSSTKQTKQITAGFPWRIHQWESWVGPTCLIRCLSCPWQANKCRVGRSKLRSSLDPGIVILGFAKAPSPPKLVILLFSKKKRTEDTQQIDMSRCFVQALGHGRTHGKMHTPRSSPPADEIALIQPLSSSGTWEFYLNS